MGDQGADIDRIAGHPRSRPGQGSRRPRWLAPAATQMPAVSSAPNNFSGQTNVWAGATATGVAAGSEGAYGAVTSRYEGATG